MIQESVFPLSGKGRAVRYILQDSPLAKIWDAEIPKGPTRHLQANDLMLSRPHVLSLLAFVLLSTFSQVGKPWFLSAMPLSVIDAHSFLPGAFAARETV